MEAIYAVDINNGLSKDGMIPWSSKKDLKFFMNITMNNIVIMGKKTYFSLPNNYRPLKKRLNIVLTSNPKNYFNKNEKNQELIITSDYNIFKKIMLNKETFNKNYPFLKKDFKIFFIGGKTIYEQFIPLCHRVWVTTIKKAYFCDLFFHYDYSKHYKEEIIDEDDELIIKKYEQIIKPI